MANPELQVDQKIREANERMDRIEKAVLEIAEVGLGPEKLKEVKAMLDDIKEVQSILDEPKTSSDPTS